MCFYQYMTEGVTVGFQQCWVDGTAKTRPLESDTGLRINLLPKENSLKNHWVVVIVTFYCRDTTLQRLFVFVANLGGSTAQYTLYNVYGTNYTVLCTIFSVLYNMNNVHYTVFTVQCTLYTVHPTQYNVHCILCILHCTL